MGVIRNLSNISDPFAVLIDDVLDVIEQAQEEQEVNRRNSRRIRHREPVVPQPTGSARFPTRKSGKRYRRAENANFLMSLADDDDREVSVYDFIPKSVSAFAQLLMERDNMEAWNNFINQSDEDQLRILKKIDQGHKIDLGESSDCINNGDGIQDTSNDGRSGHPAFSADECFRRIDSDLRTALKKKHVPLGTLAQLEKKISTFFQTKPCAVYKSQLQSSYDRLMVHAACQYMNLYSNSYNQGGIRWTRVRNSNRQFNPPAVTLSAYLERRALHRCCGM